MAPSCHDVGVKVERGRGPQRLRLQVARLVQLQRPPAPQEGVLFAVRIQVRAVERAPGAPRAHKVEGWSNLRVGKSKKGCGVWRVLLARGAGRGAARMRPARSSSSLVLFTSRNTTSPPPHTAACAAHSRRRQPPRSRQHSAAQQSSSPQTRHRAGCSGTLQQRRHSASA